MKPIIKNFLNVIRRFKTAVALNIFGIAVAFATFMIVMIQVNYDYNFDKCHTDYDKIFRLEFTQFSETNATVGRKLAEHFFESSPVIVAGAVVKFVPGWNVSSAGTINRRGFFKEQTLQVTSGFTEVFTFDFVEGDKDALKKPGQVIIPLSMARKLFGKESPIGQQFDGGNGESQIIGAVYRDFPANTIVNNCAYSVIPEDEDYGQSYLAYFRIHQAIQTPQAHELVESLIQDYYSKSLYGENFDWKRLGAGLRFTALPDVHYTTDALYDPTPKANRQTIMLLFVIAVVIVVIAAINFTNFSTALTPMRIKSINTQRVLGARQNSLRFALIFEAVVICIISYFVALLLVTLFHDTLLSKLINADLSFSAHPLIFGGTAFVAIFTGFLAGIYPSRYITSFAPALALKGTFGLSPKGRNLRNTLIGIQYTVSFALIIATSFMYMQNHFMQNSSLGYDKNALITVNISQIENRRNVFTNQIKEYSGIEDITFGQYLLSSSDTYQMFSIEFEGESFWYQVIPVHYTFLKVMGIEVTEGRDFRQDDINSRGAFVFNETARKKFNLELGENGAVGFIPDIKFASFRAAIEPMAFYVSGVNHEEPLNYAYIKLKTGTNLRAAMSHIHSTLAGFDAEYPFEVCFYDEILQRLYEKETALNALITLFSLIAIFISIAGVFGLVVFDSECRRKEIGIRKVLGASCISIILMFNKIYFRILTICFMLATPLAWYAVTRWLDNFAYKTPMYWWIYLLAFVAVGIITTVTVTFQNWRVAIDNPVNAIKSE